eukprot:7051306-Pyramimonas_sp.AAC.1
MKQARADIQNLKNGDARSCASGSTRYGSGGTGDTGSGAGYTANWVPSYIECKGLVSRDGWGKNREIKTREAMKQQTLTYSITKLWGLASLDATHNAVFDRARTAGENIGRD